MKTIQGKQSEARRLASCLDKSLKIKQLWPEAFEGGYTCRPVAVFGMAPYPDTHKIIKRAYLKRSDGVCKEIIIQEYIEHFGIPSQEKVNNLFKQVVLS